MSQKPSLKTVATAAGVSPSTVSNAYNRPQQLSAELRARILRVAREQGYAGPDAAARSLRSGRAGAIGVLFTARLPYAFSDPYCLELLAGAAEVAETTRTSLVLMPVAIRESGASAAPYDLHDSVAAVRHAVIDGAIADGIADDNPALRVLTDRGLPLVRSVEGPGRSVVVDEHAAALALGGHLRELGHRRLTFVAEGEEGEALRPYARLRLAGLCSALGAGAVTVRAAGPNTVDAGRSAAESILRGRASPTAVVGSSDVLALGVIDALRAHGMRAGYDVSVAGFDDVPAADVAGLTTVRQPVREKGRIMARMLLDPSFQERQVTLPTQLVVRASTQVAAAAGRSAA
jgi:DNA-binding LacI/PurR family transcriptional regulator